MSYGKLADGSNCIHFRYLNYFLEFPLALFLGVLESSVEMSCSSSEAVLGDRTLA